MLDMWRGYYVSFNHPTGILHVYCFYTIVYCKYCTFHHLFLFLVQYNSKQFIHAFVPTKTKKVHVQGNQESNLFVILQTISNM